MRLRRGYHTSRLLGMPCRRTVVGTLVFLCVLGALVSPSGSGASRPAKTRILVEFKPGSSTSSHDNAIRQVSGRLVSIIPDLRVHVVDVPGTAAEALATLKQNRTVEFAEPDSVSHAQESLPDDPSFPAQFSIGGGAWGWYTTHTTQAWDISQGSPSTVIAILDTGLQTAGLDDFTGQVVSGWNVLTGTSDTSSEAGLHGTYVAGVAGLAGNNGIGNAGYCPKCSIMPVQVGTDETAQDSDIAAGVTWATDHGARVINLSWASTTYSQTLQDAITYAHSHGVLITAAAGNSNCDCETYPSGDTDVIGVAGTVSGDTKSGDSNYGSWVKVAAPESNITAWPSINGAPGYAPTGGTSLAAPVVAGIAGLIFSADPSLTNTQVEDALESTAAPVSGFTVQYGRVDALAAIESATGTSDPQASSAPVNTTPASIYYETNGDWNYQPLGTAAPQVGQVLLRGQGSWTGSAPLSVYAVKWQRCTAAGASCTTVSTTAKYTVQAGDAGLAFKLSVTVKNSLGSTTSTTALTAPVGSAPVPGIITLPAVSGTAKSGQMLQTTDGTWSNSPTSYTYAWQRCDATGATNCAAISGATSSSYVLTSTDVHHTIRSQVTAKNANGDGSAFSVLTAAVVGTAPVSTAAPTITGVAITGSPLTGTTGTWTGTPVALTERWLHCNPAGDACVAIAGATGTTYIPTAADVGTSIRFWVRAANSAGAASRESPHTAVVASNLVPHFFAGTLDGGVRTAVFVVKSGAGESDATLTLARATPTAVTLTVHGATVHASRGGSTTTPITLNLEGLAAGTYTYRVSWTATTGSLRFALRVAAPPS